MLIVIMSGNVLEKENRPAKFVDNSIRIQTIVVASEIVMLKRYTGGKTPDRIAGSIGPDAFLAEFRPASCFLSTSGWLYRLAPDCNWQAKRRAPISYRYCSDASSMSTL
jgi:hypothetical protein